MVGTIKVFEILNTRFNDEEARFVVEEIEKITDLSVTVV